MERKNLLPQRLLLPVLGEAHGGNVYIGEASKKRLQMQEEFLTTIISYVCENGDITKDIVVNEAPFDEKLSVFTAYMLPLAKYIDNLHGVIMPA